MNGETTVYIGEHFEWEPASGKMTKHYHAGGQSRGCPTFWTAPAGVDCLSGNCNGTDILLGILPFVNGGLGDAADAARASGSTDALAHADDIVETAGQFLSHMRNLYQRVEMDKHFPQAWQQLQMAIEEWE